MMSTRIFLMALVFSFSFAITANDSIPGKHQILKDSKVTIDDNRQNKLKLYVKDGVFEFRAIEYNKIIPAYRFKKDPIKIETYEAVFLDADNKEIFQANIGNPLLVKAQHIGFEDSDFFYGYDNEASFFIPFPKNMEPHAVVIYRDLLDTKEKIQKILIK
tara:strand:- start:481 stop:960 length:480 start_codon:yes stop_codon:yes gene_type:complete